MSSGGQTAENYIHVKSYEDVRICVWKCASEPSNDLRKTASENHNPEHHEQEAVGRPLNMCVYACVCAPRCLRLLLFFLWCSPVLLNVLVATARPVQPAASRQLHAERVRYHLPRVRSALAQNFLSCQWCR